MSDALKILLAIAVVALAGVFIFGFKWTVPYKIGRCEIPYEKVYLQRYFGLSSEPVTMPYRTQVEMFECLCQEPRESAVIAKFVNESFCTPGSELYDLCGATDGELLCKLRPQSRF